MESLGVSPPVGPPSPGALGCGRCGRQAQASDRFCRYCGEALVVPAAADMSPTQPPPPVYPAPVAAAPSTNGMAVASLVLGILWLWGLGSLLALIFGVMGKNQIDRSGGLETGRGMAIAGLVLGIVGLVGAVVLALIVAGAMSASGS